MAAPYAGAAGADDEEYEICNEEGFVYKRRSGLYPDVPPPSALSTAPDPEAVRRRRRRDALLRLRDKRRRELARWEALERKHDSQVPSLRPPPPQAPPTSPRAASDAATSASASILDDLLARADVQEAILKKVAGLCDEVHALCRAHEEDFVDAITALPVWGDPKELLLSLQTPDEPGDMNFIEDYQNEGNGGFQRSEDRHDCVARGYDQRQEAAGVSPTTVHSIKESGKTMERGPYQCKTRTELGDDPSVLVENRKKKRLASPAGSGSANANKQKRFNQSTSPNPVSVSSRPTTRRAAAAAKFRNQEAPS